MREDDPNLVYKNAQDRDQVLHNRFNAMIQQQSSFQNPFSLIHLDKAHSITQTASLISTPNHL
jgi:hypothetical protein